MPKISAATAALRRDHILDAADKCFAERGIHVTVDDICARAGVSKAAFYMYFSSKDAAIEAVAQKHAGVISRFAALGSVEELTNALARLTTRRPNASARLELETWTHALTLPSLRAELQRNADGLRTGLTTSVSKLSGRAVGKHQPPPPVVAEILTIFSLGLIAWSALGTEQSSRSAETSLTALVGVLVTETPEPRARRPGAGRGSRSR